VAWAGYSRAERSRLAWEEHDRVEEVVHAAETALDQGDAQALEQAFRQGAVFTPARAAEAMLKEIDEARPETARVLLDHGADVKAENGRALADAIRLGFNDLAIRLVEHGADVRAQGSGPVPVPALNIAVECRTMEDLELVRRLLERGADPNARGGGSMTPLTELMARGEPTENGQALLELLLEYGADVNLRDGQGLTPLNWIEALPESDWQRDLAAFLRSRGAKPHRPFEN
jgi:hypothetical protein